MQTKPSTEKQYPGRQAIIDADQMIGEERVEDAIKRLKTFLEERDNPRVWLKLGRAYQIAGEELLARAILRSVVLKFKDPHIVDVIAARLPYTKSLVIDDLKLMYFNIPKCGSSSLKDAFILASGGEPKGGASHFFVSHLTRLMSFAEIDGKYADYQSIAIVRRPQERLRSYWRKNIQQETTLRREGHGKDQYYGLPTMPTYEQILTHFQDYRRVFRDFRHHTDSIVGYLGDSRARIKNIFGVSETRKAIALVGDVAGKPMPEIHNMASESPFDSPSPRERDLEQALLESFYRAEEEKYFSPQK